MLRTTSFNLTARWFPALTTLIVWALVAAVVSYWVLLFAGVSGPPTQAPTATRSTATEPAQSHVQQALGSVSAEPVATVSADAGARFVLSGVVAAGSGRGAALIAVDGQAPKAFKAGQSVAEGVVLHSLAARQAHLSATLQGPVTLTLDMPSLFPKP
jgi:general secretion pathway protein C